MIPKSAEEVQDMLFGNSAQQNAEISKLSKAQISNLFGESKQVPIDILKTIEAELFSILQRNGYTREQTVPAVANFIANLNRVQRTTT
jgi:hypothetical protein